MSALLRRFPIGTRLSAGFAAVLLLVAAMTTTALINLGSIQANIDDIVNDNVRKMALNTTMLNALNRIQSILRDAAIKAQAGDSAGGLRRREDVAAQRSAYDAARRGGAAPGGRRSRTIACAPPRSRPGRARRRTAPR